MKSDLLTLCLIVKNEKNFLEKCLSSTSPYVYETIIADTGSTDNTLEIAKKFTSHVESISFDHGFSEARNSVLKKVKTPWVLFLDADEYFDEHAIKSLVNLLPTLSQNVDALKFLRFNFFQSGAFYTSDVIRVFRNHPDIYYSGLIVDSIKPSITIRGTKIQETPICLNHFGHTRSRKLRDEKSIKYLKLLDEEIALNPNRLQALGYKALILRTLGKFDEAVWIADALIEKAPNEGFSHFVKAHVMRSFNDHKACISHYSQAITIEGPSALYLNSRALSFLGLGEVESAKKDLILALKLFPNHLHLNINLGLIFEAENKFKEALKAYETVALSNPGFLEQNLNHIFEYDPFTPLIYDTAYGYKGLSHHINFCKHMLVC